MDDKLFREMLNLLMAAAEDRRDAARTAGEDTEADQWSAIAGNLDYARQRLRR